jgi:mannose-6-phosphate isomerase
MDTMPLYPLKFKPRYLEKMWGGQKIRSVLGKPIPNKPIGESWELFDFPPGVVDHSQDWISSEVAEGPLADKTLHALLGEYGKAIHGDVKLVGPHGQFPVLIKFLDANDDLSVQVHPDKVYAAAHAGAHLKNEAWYIVQADPGSRILKGLKKGASRQRMVDALAEGTVESLIRSITVKPGECFYLPSGTVHALGAGILAAEVQTPSDTTFRVFDFNRIDPSTGKTRTLHIEQALECIHFSDTSVQPPVVAEAANFPLTSQLATCEAFTMSKTRMQPRTREPIQHAQPVVWMVLNGQMTLHAEQSPPIEARKGNTILLPALMKNPSVETKDDCEWIEVTFPIG